MPAAEQPVREPVRSAAELSVPDPAVDVIAIGASAGGVEALRAVVRSLPPDLGASVLVVLHVAQAGTSVLPEILSRAGVLPVATALDGEPLLHGRVYVAPPGCHLLVEGNVVRLSRGPRENGHRPAIDSLFRSVAEAFGARAAGVILSGMLDDGTAGLHEIKRQGGIAIVQDPATAMYPGMPRSAAEHVGVDALLQLEDVAPALAHIADRSAGSHGGDSVPDRQPSSDAQLSNGNGTRFTCPDCGGVLFEYGDGPVHRFACSVGHAYSLESLVDGQAVQVEGALWAAVRILEDRVILLRKMERYSRDAERERAAGRFAERAGELIEQAQVLRTTLERAVEPPLVGDGAIVDQT